MTGTDKTPMIDLMSEKKRGRKPRPDSKRQQGGDRHADPRFTFHLEQELLDALESYIATFPHEIGKGQVMRDVLRDFLRDKGHFPPKKKADK